MRTTEKDILWICKGHYDKDKYPKLEDALDAYYRKYYDISKEDIPTLSYRFMYELWMIRCVETFLTPEKIKNFWWNVIHERCIKENEFLNKESATDFYEVMFFRIVKWLTLLSVKDDDGNWIIDMSDYIGKINIF